MTVLVPVPKRSNEVYGFFTELAYVLNAHLDTVVVQIDEVEVLIKACYVRTSDNCEGMDFILEWDDENGNEMVWTESFSSITISSVGDDIVLYPVLSHPIVVLQVA